MARSSSRASCGHWCLAYNYIERFCEYNLVLRFYGCGFMNSQVFYSIIAC